MDPQEPIAPQPTPHSFQEPIKKSSEFPKLVGKLLLFLIIAVALILGGYFLGLQANPATLVTAPVPTEKPLATATPTAMPPTPTPASQNTKAVKAGLSGATSFKPYSIDVPQNWTDARETTITAGIDKLTLTKNGYSVTIYQAPMGNGGCIYKGDPPNAMAQSFTDFADINGKSGKYRRSWNQGTGQSLTYTICQKTDTSYSVMTTFGSISIVAPNPAEGAMLSEVDGIIASLVTQ